MVCAIHLMKKLKPHKQDQIIIRLYIWLSTYQSLNGFDRWAARQSQDHVSKVIMRNLKLI